MKNNYIYQLVYNSSSYFFDNEEQAIANVEKLGKILKQSKTRFTVQDKQGFIFEIFIKKLKLNEEI
jgi:hypothetical protein